MRVEVTKKPGRSTANTNSTADKQKDSVMVRDMENEEIEDLEEQNANNGARKSRKMNEWLGLFWKMNSLKYYYFNFNYLNFKVNQLSNYFIQKLMFFNY